VPIGCGAGGRIGRVRFFQTGDLGTYLAAVQEGRKPVASGVELAERAQTIDRICAEIQQGRIAPAAWTEPGDPLRDELASVLGQWTRAGLLTATGEGYVLTAAGQFWNVQMADRLARLVQSDAAPQHATPEETDMRPMGTRKN
jgi:oxygen-independent coproporphyrinogen-3 oxidase